MIHQQQRKRGQFGSLKTDDPLWWRLLVGVPKNLVYVFALIILMAFLGMVYITYTETDMQQFLTEDFKFNEVLMVDPVFQHLQKVMDLAVD